MLPQCYPCLKDFIVFLSHWYIITLLFFLQWILHLNPSINLTYTPGSLYFYMTDSVKALFDNQNFYGDDNYERLTPREQQIFRMIAEGKTPKDISFEINISTKTISVHSVHRENLLRKMGIKTNTEIVHLALKLEIIQLKEI